VVYLDFFNLSRRIANMSSISGMGAGGPAPINNPLAQVSADFHAIANAKDQESQAKAQAALTADLTAASNDPTLKTISHPLKVMAEIANDINALSQVDLNNQQALKDAQNKLVQDLTTASNDPSLAKVSSLLSQLSQTNTTAFQGIDEAGPVFGQVLQDMLIRQNYSSLYEIVVEIKG
jgi:hypothetical protein